jgi:hypothetical protein
MEDMQLLRASIRTQITEMNPSLSTPSDEGPIFALQGEVPSATITTRAGWED